MDEPSKSSTKLGSFYSISHSLSLYFSATIPSSIHDPSALLATLKKNYPGLEPAERLAIINTAPRNLCVLSLLVEDAGDRFSEEQMEAIVAAVGECIPEVEKMEVDEEDEEE